MKQRVTLSQIEIFLREADQLFPIPLSCRQDLTAYAKKLYEKATLCVACVDEEIVSMVAGYTENVPDACGYIAIVATLPKAERKGLASRLVKEFITICERKNLKAVHLYAVPDNVPAINMYAALGFRELQIADEPRKEDAHLIYYLEEV